MTRLFASYRLRLPLALSIAAISTALLMAFALGLQTLQNLREDQGRNARRLGHAMAGLLVNALRQDDVWLAYSLLRGPDDADGDLIWVLADTNGRVFASNRPRTYRLDEPLGRLLAASDANREVEDPSGQGVAMAGRFEIRRLIEIPLDSEGTRVGVLFALLSDRPFLERFYEILLGGVLVTVAVLMLLLPVGWLSGRRMMAPLARLADCMARVGRDDPRMLDCSVATGDDEIGQLGRCFTEMLAALSDKAQLEGRMLQSERLAAVGRVAAGIAHEINNPLGGMVMAIDTYRGSGPIDERTRRLLDLLDRALRQMQETVSALLVEARADRRVLTASDFEDVRTLTEPRLTRCGVPLAWHVDFDDFDERTSLPATPVRQLLLNLVLNALNAAGDGGSAAVKIAVSDERLRIDVENTGGPLPPERLDRLFEPYPSRRPDGEGLGLWVCYQIVSQLRGSIEMDAQAAVIRVRVQLPIQPENDDG